MCNRMKTYAGLRFTLIELLVVIAIIAILASLLMPALSNSKIKGRQIACFNNLKSLHLSTMMYCTDNNDWLPIRYDSTGYWTTHIVDGKYNSSNPRLNGVFGCPSEFGTCAFDNTVSGWCGTHYGFNMYIHYQVVSPPLLTMNRLNTLPTPLSKLVMLGDSRGLVRTGISLDPESWAARHGTRMNISFADGHMESLSLNALNQKYYSGEVKWHK